MKTWEMIKELTENPSKEFIRKKDGLHIKTNKDGELIWDSGYQFIQLSHEWEEIKKPVDFMTAIESGKRIRVQHKYTDNPSNYYRNPKEYKEYLPLHHIFGKLSYDYAADSMREIIENGKWYIED